jgi:hypothetical protein
MMADDGSMDWIKNEEWYGYNPETKTYYLTEKAPPEIRKSFQKWLDFNEEFERTGIYR